MGGKRTDFRKIDHHVLYRSRENVPIYRVRVLKFTINRFQSALFFMMREKLFLLKNQSFRIKTNDAIDRTREKRRNSRTNERTRSHTRLPLFLVVVVRFWIRFSFPLKFAHFGFKENRNLVSYSFSELFQNQAFYILVLALI